MSKTAAISVLRSLVKKEFLQVLRDFRMRGILFGAPLFLLIIFGYAVNTDLKDVRLAIHDEDRTSASRELIRTVTASHFFMLHSFSPDRHSADRLLDQGAVEVIIRIPRGFSHQIKSGKTATVQIILDGTDSNRAAMINSYLTEIINGKYFPIFARRVSQTVLQRIAARDPTDMAAIPMKRPPQGIPIVERSFFNPQLSSTNYFLPGVIVLLISLITIMLTSMSIVKEREIGTIEQIIVSPLKPMHFMMGKTIPFVIIGLIDMTIVSVLSIAWFGVPFKGSFLFLLFSSFIFILSTLAVGLYISTISKTQQQAMLSFFLFFFPAILFSGFVFPIYSMPEPIQILTYLNPLRYFIVIIRAIFLKGSGPLILWKELLILLVMGVTLIIISARRFKKRLE